MASTRPLMTRASSSDSLSEHSNIEVGRSASVASGPVSASTPPTSVADTHSMTSSKPIEDVDTVGRRSTRIRAQVISYNVNQLFDGSRATSAEGARDRFSASPHQRKKAKLGNVKLESSPDIELSEALQSEWDVPDEPSQTIASSRKGKAAIIKERVKHAARQVATKMSTVLGKRKFDQRAETQNPKHSKILKELDTGKRGVLDELDLDTDFVVPAPRPSKKLKATHTVKQTQESTAAAFGALQKTSDGKVKKKWQPQGLYVGQESGASAIHHSHSVDQPVHSGPQESSTLDDPQARKSFMTLPMFNYLDKTRDFIIPFDVFAPSLKKGDEKPKDWHKVNRNRIIGEAREIWEKADRLPASACVCQRPEPGELGCDFDCLNRVMQYECNEDNCRLPASMCSNRAFAELAVRTKKGGSFDIGVEVLKTPNRGFGVRACRTFAPGQIIMEYTGEIISESECQRRMREVYKDRTCYYLMELERNLVIDGTKGSMARFINHSCEPNCEVRMVKVNGIPRMGVFAGESGIATGQELTYDYNFDNFGETRQACYCGALTCRGFLSKRLNAAEQKKLAKEELEKKLQAAAEAQKRSEEETRKKQVKADRGSNWRGWVSVDDADVKERLKEEKRRREEAEMNSSRARRMAARRGSTSAAEKPSIAKSRAARDRRQTIAVETIRKEQTTRSPSIRSTGTSILGKRSRALREPDSSSATPSAAKRSFGPAAKIRKSLPSNPSDVADDNDDDDDTVTLASSKTARPRPASSRLSLDSTSTMKPSICPTATSNPNERPTSLLAKVTARAFGSSAAGLRQSRLNFVKSGS